MKNSMRQPAIATGHQTAGYSAGGYPSRQTLGPREIGSISLKRTSIRSRLLAIPLAGLVLPLMMFNPFNTHREG